MPGCSAGGKCAGSVHRGRSSDFTLPPFFHQGRNSGFAPSFRFCPKNPSPGHGRAIAGPSPGHGRATAKRALLPSGTIWPTKYTPRTRAGALPPAKHLGNRQAPRKTEPNSPGTLPHFSRHSRKHLLVSISADTPSRALATLALTCSGVILAAMSRECWSTADRTWLPPWSAWRCWPRRWSRHGCRGTVV